MKNRFQWMEVNGRTVLKQDFSNLKQTDLMKFLNMSHELIKDRDEKGIIVVTNADQAVFDHQVMKHFSRICEINKPYIGASAIYNCAFVTRAAIESAAQLSNRSFLMFHDDEAAEKWLESLK